MCLQTANSSIFDRHIDALRATRRSCLFAFSASLLRALARATLRQSGHNLMGYLEHCDSAAFSQGTLCTSQRNTRNIWQDCA